MNPALLGPLIRLRFTFTSRAAADRTIERAERRYLELAAGLSAEQGRCPVAVPPMRGVDPEMRDWSYFQLLAHNALVNRSMTEVVVSLATGAEPGPAARIDPKRDVLPGPDVGPEQVAVFRDSITAHQAAVAGLERLRGAGARRHPLFGTFDAHKWHCMLGFHLVIHLKQARLVATGAAADR